MSMSEWAAGELADTLARWSYGMRDLHNLNGASSRIAMESLARAEQVSWHLVAYTYAMSEQTRRMTEAYRKAHDEMQQQMRQALGIPEEIPGPLPGKAN